MKCINDDDNDDTVASKRLSFIEFLHLVSYFTVV